MDITSAKLVEADEKVDERTRFFILPLQIVVYRFSFFFLTSSSSSSNVMCLLMRSKRGDEIAPKSFPHIITSS